MITASSAHRSVVATTIPTTLPPSSCIGRIARRAPKDSPMFNGHCSAQATVRRHEELHFPRVSQKRCTPKRRPMYFWSGHCFGTVGGIVVRMLLQDKVAIITGTATGIGYEIARVFAEHGARLLALDRNAEQNASSAKSIDASGERVVPMVVDVRDRP